MSQSRDTKVLWLHRERVWVRILMCCIQNGWRITVLLATTKCHYCHDHNSSSIENPYSLIFWGQSYNPFSCPNSPKAWNATGITSTILIVFLQRHDPALGRRKIRIQTVIGLTPASRKKYDEKPVFDNVYSICSGTSHTSTINLWMTIIPAKWPLWETAGMRNTKILDSQTG